MEINVNGGTAKFGENLCLTCRWFQKREDAEGQVVARCSEFGRRPLRAPVVRCTEYDNKTTPTQQQYEQIAWLITPDVKSGQIGFRRIKDMTDEEKRQHDIAKYY